MIRLVMGEMATMLLASQKMIPGRLISDGFEFRFADVDAALADLVNRS
jgi:NAD dependent epimerase/dehydratase family enzyme